MPLCVAILRAIQQTCQSLSWWSVPPRPRWPTHSSGNLCSSRATPGTEWLPPERWNGLCRVLRETLYVHASRMFIRTLRFNKETSSYQLLFQYSVSECLWRLKSSWFKGAASNFLIRRTKHFCYLTDFTKISVLRNQTGVWKQQEKRARGAEPHFFLIHSETLSACQSIHIFGFAKNNL